MNYNKVILAGNLTRDPEIRYATTGLAIAKFSLAINRTTKANGETRNEVVYVDIDALGKTAETIGAHCKKGTSLLVEGRLKLDSWEDKQTHQKRSKLGVVCDSFQFVDRKPASGTPTQTPEPTAAQTSEEQPTPVEDDVPF